MTRIDSRGTEVSRRTVLGGAAIAATALVTTGLDGGAAFAVPDGSKARFRGARRINGALGYGMGPVSGPRFDSEEFISSLAPRHAAIYRYPGGNIGNFWDWRTGWHIEPMPDWTDYAWDDGRTPQPETLENLKTLVDAAGVTPCLMLNLATATLEDQLEMLRHARSIGLPVQYVEFGNEFYWDDFAPAFATPKDYATRAGQWARAIKDEFPDAQIAAVADNEAEFKTFSTRYTTWNAALAEEIASTPEITAVTMHPYVFLRQLTEITDLSEESMKRYIALSFAVPASVSRSMHDFPDAVQGWMTEYNVIDNAYIACARWIHGIHVANMALQYLSDPRVDMALFWRLIAGPTQSAVFGPKSAATFESHFGYPCVPYAVTAEGRALDLISSAMEQMTYQVPAALPESAVVSTTLQGRTYEYPSLVGMHFVGRRGFVTAEGHSTVILNVTGTGQTVDLRRECPLGQTAVQYWTDPTRAIADGDADLSVESGPVSNAVVLRPFSITVVD